ncbi:MAG: anthranilate phosphoribosyltransferase [Chthoniobacterales bacterium]|nr:anthranilate phosphoribosyltransferase [Chthoniobacterales bacterium]
MIDLREVVEVAARRSLDRQEIGVAVEGLLDSSIELELKASLLETLQARGESVGEILGFVEELLNRSERPQLSEAKGPRMDVCGTGGDGAGLLNISTAVMFVVAGCGVEVVKHGNRGVTSRSGGADALEELGVAVEIAPDVAGDFLEECGFVFLFAPLYHPSFRVIAPVRKLLAGRGKVSIFNILGPLLNPARPEYQLAGIFRRNFLKPYAEVLAKLKRECAWVVQSWVGEGVSIDEWTPCGVCLAAIADKNGVSCFEIQPEEVGVKRCKLNELQGGTAQENAKRIEQLLKGELSGATRDAVLLNSAAALCVCGKASDLRSGIEMADEALRGGEAFRVLEKARKFSGELLGAS